MVVSPTVAVVTSPVTSTTGVATATPPISAAPTTPLIPTTAANLSPTANAASVTANGGIAVPITLQGKDPENKPLVFAIAQLPTHGRLGGSMPNLIYTAEPAFVGVDAFTFTVNDGQVSSSPSTVSVIVTGPIAVTKKPIVKQSCRTVRGRKTCLRRTTSLRVVPDSKSLFVSNFRRL